jgi:hypothetical protein
MNHYKTKNNGLIYVAEMTSKNARKEFLKMINGYEQWCKKQGSPKNATKVKEHINSICNTSIKSVFNKHLDNTSIYKAKVIRECFDNDPYIDNLLKEEYSL